MMKIDKAIVASAVLWVLLGTSLVIVKKLHRKPQENSAVVTAERQHASTHYFEFNSEHHRGHVGSCSATSIAPHALLAAGHCIFNDNEIFLDKEKEPVMVLLSTSDGSDHTIYILKYTFKSYVEINQRKLIEQEKVHFWGNPGHSKDVFRSGVFTGLDEDGDERFILPVFGGDSGSGVFDENGFIIAIISMGNESAESFAFPLKFTPEQLALVDVKIN